jgi:hypothetical protein
LTTTPAGNLASGQQDLRGEGMMPTYIADRTDEVTFVYRVEAPTHCYKCRMPLSQVAEYNKKYRDDSRARLSRFAGTFVKRPLSRGSVALIPYEVERQRLASRLGNLLKSRMFDTCYRWPIESLPISPASMALDYLGCSLSALVEKFEAQMQDGMTWDNFGARGWVIDHIMPVSRLDFRKISHVRRGCHFGNLRPCWEAENIRKGSKVLEEVQP